MLAPEFLPVWGGVGTYIVELVRHLSNQLEFHVVTPYREGFGKHKISSGSFDFKKYFGDNVHVHFVCKANDTFFYNAKFQYACLRRVPGIVRKENIDLIHSHTAQMPDLLLQLKDLRVPILTTVHTTIKGQREGIKESNASFRELELSEKMLCLTYPTLRAAEKLYFSKKRFYLTVSNWMKEQILEHNRGINSSEVFVVHNSVDTEFFSPDNKAQNETETVLFTGRLVAVKGLIYLVKAIPKILDQYPETLFRFIGPGSFEPYREMLIRRGVPERNFKFIGYLKSPAELVCYYRNSNIYVAPTLYENLPIRILEAMSCRLPVVASNVSGIPEAIKDNENGLLIESRSVDQLASSICRLIGDDHLRRMLGENARKTIIEKFNWNSNSKKTLEAYIKVIDEYCS